MKIDLYEAFLPWAARQQGKGLQGLEQKSLVLGWISGSSSEKKQEALNVKIEERKRKVQIAIQDIHKSCKCVV